MSEFRIEVVRVGAVQKHPNADSLSITQIHGGYPCILRVGATIVAVWASELDVRREEALRKASTDAAIAVGFCHGRGGVIVEDGGCMFQCQSEPAKGTR